ncbi:hypothetical protein C900_01222 [Fulvivirga imtechensis AK7]|uniref:Outer membrane protein beta-barrel domain-containing protein n=1 Tax=Fulvivirga imtechensis AK7 TaxID=1237149 RepID=L8JWG8_9BACT|nr:outer membrane beta-barrel protein [Fulvivirga imtechensis]ELR72548.1 hypothetical protein C900_01222 [Fulvivirga imtechensis AK7]
MMRFANKNSIWKIIIFSGLFFLATVQSEAQLLIGPRIGGQVSWITLDDKDLKDEYEYEIEPLIGYHGGFTVAFQVQKRFYLETNLLYSRKGKVIKGTGDQLLKLRSINHFVELPIIYRMDFKAKIGGSREFKWFVGVGPNISYWWRGNGILESDDLAENGIMELEYDVQFGGNYLEEELGTLVVTEPNRLQLGINFATGVMLEPLTGHLIVIDLRFELGHSFQSKNDFAHFAEDMQFSEPVRSRNMALRLGVSYLFDTKVSERKKGKSNIKK